MCFYLDTAPLRGMKLPSQLEVHVNEVTGESTRDMRL